VGACVHSPIFFAYIFSSYYISAMDAFADGITAAQVLSFLETNAHPLARGRTSDGLSQVCGEDGVRWLYVCVFCMLLLLTIKNERLGKGYEMEGKGSKLPMDTRIKAQHENTHLIIVFLQPFSIFSCSRLTVIFFYAPLLPNTHSTPR